MPILQNTAKRFLQFFLLVAVLGAFLWAGYVGMAVDSRGQMSDCPFIEVTALCQMSSLEHLVAWQNTFIAVPDKRMTVLAALLLFGLFLALAAWSASHIRALANVFYSALCHRIHFVLIPRILQEAFSSGVLNPKIF